MPRQSILNNLERADRGIIISHGLDSNNLDINNRAQREHRTYALESLLNDPFDAATGAPRFANRAAFDALRIDEQRERLDDGFTFGQGMAVANAVREMIRDQDALKTGGRYSPELATIANSKEIIDEANPDNARLLQMYAGVLRYENIIGKLNRNQSPSLDEEKELRPIVSAGVSRVKYNQLKAAGYREELARAGAKIASISPSEEISNNLLRIGATELHTEAERQVRAVAGNNYRDNVSEAVGRAMETMVRSGDRKKEETAANLYLKAYNGYSLGERDFRTVFP